MQTGSSRASFKPRLLVGVALLCCAPSLFAQTQPALEQTNDGDQHYTLHVTAREVVLDVIARDKDDHPIGDLKASEFQIFEVPAPGQQRQRKLSVFETIDPAVRATAKVVPAGGFRVALSGGCAPGITVHYRLSFQPGADGWKGGYHQILVTTTRPGITLIFRHRYYVGLTEADAPVPVKPGVEADRSLRNAACFHPDVPASIALMVHQMPSGATEPRKYSLVIQPDSLGFSSISDADHRVELDYGACLFNADGKALSFLQLPVTRRLSAKEYDKAMTDGFSDELDLPRMGDPVLVRFVVRDRATGNLGTIEMATEGGIPPAKRDRALTNMMWQFHEEKPVITKTQGGFGSIVAQPGSMCGDVYQLEPGTRKIITNFGVQEAIGVLHTYNLNQPLTMLTSGLPGITPSPEWFAIDYYGEFWTAAAGKYKFLIASDDGVKLFVDDQLVMEDDGIHNAYEQEKSVKLEPGRHTMHVSYFQGPSAVALEVRVKPPNGAMEVFDTRDYPAPAEHAIASGMASP